MSTKKNSPSKIKKFFKTLGPGIITGASDDDPSGIATYSQAGAAFGFATLWTALVIYPLITAVQGMCARIGLVTSQGLTTTLKNYYPRYILYIMMIFSVPATVLNIGADIAGMGAVSNLLFPKIPSAVFCIAFTIILMYTIIKFSYVKIARILKWLCLTLILYIIVPFFIKLNWKDVAINTFIPTIHFNKEFLEILVALLGTTISPYLFFWQAIMEAEDANHNTKKVIINKQILGDMSTDVNIGTLASCLVMFFIILTTGAVLHNSGIHQINTVDEAAKALEPLTGKFSYLCFAIGVLGTGFLAIPVLGGSLSYIVAETFGWEQGLDKKFYEAKGFYLVIIASLLIGLGINFVGISPVKALFYTAILYGLCSPILIAIIMHIANNKKVMKKHTNTKLSNVLGTITLLIMTAAAVAMIYLQFV